MNKKGMTIIEILVSLGLISIVLIFLMSIFLKAREAYNLSKSKSDYSVAASTIIKAVGDDLENYGLYEYECENSRCDAVILTFDEFRLTKLSDRIKKVLRVGFDNNRYYISYAYEKGTTTDIKNQELFTRVYVDLPSDVILKRSGYIQLSEVQDILKIKIPISDPKGNSYDINIFGVKSKK